MGKPVLEIGGLHKSFGALQATRDVNLAVKEGEIHALIGPNGAGKTTLIAQIYGSLKPDAGQILLQGVDITAKSVEERVHLGMGRSFQISNVLMDFTVLENAIIAEQARQQAAFRFWKPAFQDSALIRGAGQILARVGLQDRQDRLVSDLAHGERRLLELALALAADPVVVLLDEPMAGAGPEETQNMTQIIKQLKGQTSILLIEHDMDAVFQLADRLTVLVEGTTIANGTPAEISANEAVREAYLGSES